MGESLLHPPRLLLRQGIVIELPQGDAWVLGRTSTDRGHVDVDLAPHDLVRGVSRWHARIQRTAQGYTIRDLGSRNETTLNGARLAPHQHYALPDGAKIGLGALTLRFFIVQ